MCVSVTDVTEAAAKFQISTFYTKKLAFADRTLSPSH